MGSKVFISLGLLLAIVLLISSEVSARDLAEDSTKSKIDVTGKELGHNNGGYGDRGGGGRGGGRGRGRYGRGGGSSGSCRHGCCKSGYHGCQSCCRYAGEAVEAQAQAKPHN